MQANPRIVSDFPTALTEKKPVLKAVDTAPAKDHFVERDGELFAGMHLILDFWGASHLDDQDHLEKALRAAVDAAGATLLHIHLHRFSPSGGISGVAVLAESHISVHTWPERDFAAFDIFMCGDAAPEKAAAVLQDAFAPARVETGEYRRGRIAGREQL